MNQLLPLAYFRRMAWVALLSLAEEPELSSFLLPPRGQQQMAPKRRRDWLEAFAYHAANRLLGNEIQLNFKK